jgi:hypothetical protein
MKIDEDPYKKTTRRRVFLKDQSIFGVVRAGPSGNRSQYACSPLVWQETTSEGHPFFKESKKFKKDGVPGGIVDFGGPFSTTKIEGSYNRGGHNAIVQVGGTPSYIDNFIGNPLDKLNWFGTDMFPLSSSNVSQLASNTNYASQINQFSHGGSSDNDLLAMGTTAITRTRPNKTPVSMTTAAVELLREGLPFRELITERRWREIFKDIQNHGLASTSVKNLSDVFLSHQFGVQPLISDIGSAIELVHRSDRVLTRLQDDAKYGATRSRYTFPNTSSVVKETSNVTYAPWGLGTSQHWLNLTGPVSEVKLETTYRKKTWFSGSWAVFMPDPSPAEENLHMLSERLRLDWGIDMDISTIWNLAPWSWLIDWEFNMGDVIENFSHFSDQSVLLKYGYIMETATASRTFSRPNVFLQKDYNATEPAFMYDIISTRKHRLRATPYGFGKTFGSLSNVQKAILAAIGVTRF